MMFHRNHIIAKSCHSHPGFRVPTSRWEQSVSSPFGLTDEDLLWKKTESSFSKEDLSTARVMLVGFEHPRRAELLEGLGRIGVKFVAVMRGVDLSRSATDLDPSLSHLIVDLEAHDCTEDAVSALLDLRKNFPRLVIVAISGSVSGDDFGMERIAICDSTLRAPVSDVRLRRGLLEAGRNHFGY